MFTCTSCARLVCCGSNFHMFKHLHVHFVVFIIRSKLIFWTMHLLTTSLVVTFNPIFLETGEKQPATDICLG